MASSLGGKSLNGAYSFGCGYFAMVSLMCGMCRLYVGYLIHEMTAASHISNKIISNLHCFVSQTRRREHWRALNYDKTRVLDSGVRSHCCGSRRLIVEAPDSDLAKSCTYRRE